ncbi:MAG: hypothetical protein KGH53_00950 [Candidatus Micrarchaeota archaeon]|nr:hypothetical protein [Candidatus Micrarchaeota archaeon]
MDFFGAIAKEIAADGFATRRIVMSAKGSIWALNRPHTSISMVADNAAEIHLGEAGAYLFKKLDFRYVLAKEMSSDLVATFHDVNSASSLILRLSAPLQSADLAKIRQTLVGWKNSNIEMRIIGMQNGSQNLSKIFDQLHKLSKASLVEVDIFGNMKRHLAFDLKTGVCYDLLLLDRTYRAGELVNDVPVETAKVADSKIKFV